MKWQYLTGALALVVVALSLSLAYHGGRMEAQETRPAVYAPQTSAAPQFTVPAKPLAEPGFKVSKDQTAAELIAIIQETKSRDTFFVSLMALVALSPKDTSILPLAIRKAEKLDLLKGMMTSEQMQPGQEMLAQMFEVLLGDKLERIFNSGACGSRRTAVPPTCNSHPQPGAIPDFVPTCPTCPQAPLPTPLIPASNTRVMPPPQPTVYR